MICPNCGNDNLPGSEECSSCLQDLTQLDRPMAHDRVERSLMENAVSVIPPPAPVTISPTATIHEAIKTMFTRKRGAVLVVDKENKLLGIFSERDLLGKVVGVHEPYDECTVSQFMTSNPETVTAEDTLAFAVHKMDIGGYRHLPVIKDGRPTGIISVRDMLRHITQLCKEN